MSGDPYWTMPRLARATLLVLLMVGLALLIVPLAPVLLLLFAAVLFAVIFRAASDPLRKLGLPETPAVLCAVLLIVALLAGFGYLFGSQIAAQFETFSVQINGAIAYVRAMVADLPFGSGLADETPDMSGLAGGVVNFAFGAFGAISNVVLILIAAVYFALHPALYLQGIERLLPKDNAPKVREALAASGRSLRAFMLGQLFTMTVLGVAVALALTLIGVPSAIALGLILALANFVPVIGPFVGAVPGILIALTVSPQLALYATLVYLVAQQIEGNLLTPLVQQSTTSIPPALLIIMLALFTTLFGITGALLAGPLAVVIYTLVTMLWTRDALGYDVKVPGAAKEPAPSEEETSQ